MTAPERIWVDWTPVDEIDLPTAMSAYTPKARQAPHFTRVDYILATPEALAASPEVQDLIAAAETRGWDEAIEAACKAALEWAAETFDGDPTTPHEYILTLKKGE